MPSEIEVTIEELREFLTALHIRLGELPDSCDVCVCGGREFSDYAFLSLVLGHVSTRLRIKWFLSGGAAGADRMAIDWATRHRYATRELKARWRAQGKAAGPIRNAELADELVKIGNVLVIALPGDRGTADMIMQCTIRKLMVIDVQEILDDVIADRLCGQPSQ